jgi:hypothetical protein
MQPYQYKRDTEKPTDSIVTRITADKQLSLYTAYISLPANAEGVAWPNSSNQATNFPYIAASIKVQNPRYTHLCSHTNTKGIQKPTRQLIQLSQGSPQLSSSPSQSKPNPAKLVSYQSTPDHAKIGNYPVSFFLETIHQLSRTSASMQSPLKTLRATRKSRKPNHLLQFVKKQQASQIGGRCGQHSGTGGAEAPGRG